MWPWKFYDRRHYRGVPIIPISSCWNPLNNAGRSKARWKPSLMWTHPNRKIKQNLDLSVAASMLSQVLCVSGESRGGHLTSSRDLCKKNTAEIGEIFIYVAGGWRQVIKLWLYDSGLEDEKERRSGGTAFDPARPTEKERKRKIVLAVRSIARAIYVLKIGRAERACTFTHPTSCLEKMTNIKRFLSVYSVSRWIICISAWVSISTTDIENYVL